MDQGQSDELNRSFYAARPWPYFQRRLSLMLVAGGNPEGLRQLIAEGVKFEDVEIDLDEGGPFAEPVSQHDQDLDDFVITESSVLLGHAAETAVRWFLAHEQQPPCPWMTMTGWRRNFRKKVQQRFEQDGNAEWRRRRLAQTLFGSSKREEFSCDSSEWDQRLEDSERVLGRLASVFLAGAPYNAAKHGLLATPGRHRIETRVSDEDKEARFSFEGRTVEHLSSTDGVWARHTDRLDFEENVILIVQATYLLRNMWLVGRARYTGQSVKGENFWFPVGFERPNPDDDGFRSMKRTFGSDPAGS